MPFLDLRKVRRAQLLRKGDIFITFVSVNFLHIENFRKTDAFYLKNLDVTFSKHKHQCLFLKRYDTPYQFIIHYLRDKKFHKAGNRTSVAIFNHSQFQFHFQV